MIQHPIHFFYFLNFCEMLVVIMQSVGMTRAFWLWDNLATKRSFNLAKPELEKQAGKLGNVGFHSSWELRSAFHPL